MNTPFLRKHGEGAEEIRVAGSREDDVIKITGHRGGKEFVKLLMDELALQRLQDGPGVDLEITVAVPGAKHGIARMVVHPGANAAGGMDFVWEVLVQKLRELSATKRGAALRRVLA